MYAREWSRPIATSLHRTHMCLIYHRRSEGLCERVFYSYAINIGSLLRYLHHVAGADVSRLLLGKQATQF
jgi:hypothetical protein